MNMVNKTESCFQCGENGTDMYGYTICDSCKNKLRLFTDKTIKKYLSPSFEEDIRNRLILLDKDYTKKRIKLLNILERLEYIKGD